MLNICAHGNHTSIFSDDNGNASKTSPLNMILACMGAKSLLSDLVEHEAMSNSLQPWGLWSARLLCPWSSSGKNIGVGCHAPLQEIFPIQGLNLHLSGLLH